MKIDAILYLHYKIDFDSSLYKQHVCFQLHTDPLLSGIIPNQNVQIPRTNTVQKQIKFIALLHCYGTE